MVFTRSFSITLLAALLLFAAFASGFLVHAHLYAHDNLPILKQAYEVLVKHGWKAKPADPALEYGMIRGMLQAYNDPFTQFIEPIQHELESNALQGNFGGIGVGLGKDPQGYWVLHPFPEGPALAAGIIDGDRLLAIEGLQITPQTPPDTIQSAIRGPVGKSLLLTIGRSPDFTPLQIKVRRAEIPLPSVTWHLAAGEPRVGVIEINLIAATTAGEIQNAVENLQSQGALYYLLDLRNNPGGLLSAGVDIARLFLKQGVVIEQQYQGQAIETMRVVQPGPFTEIPLAVLINESSASAAEIIAGALQAHQRAILVGSPSFGKDSIQLVFDLPDGSSLHVTAARWWVPGLNPPIGGHGLQPDVLVPASSQAAGPEMVLQAAVAALLEGN